MLTREDLQAIGELLKPIHDCLGRLETRVAQIDQKTADTRVLIENEVDRAIKTLGEGHQGIVDSVQQLVSQEQLEEMKTRIFALEEGFRGQQDQLRELRRKTG